jgi:DNA mismatch repair ATPase MutS
MRTHAHTHTHTHTTITTTTTTTTTKTVEQNQDDDAHPTEIEPTICVLLSTKADEDLVRAVKRVFSSEAIQTVPAHFYEPDDALRCLGECAPHLVDTVTPCSVRAFGALTSALGGTHQIRVVSCLALSRHMLVDAASLNALDIIRAQEHPSAIRGRGREKEGFSLLALFDTVYTPAGRQLLRAWVLQPLMDIVAIGDRHDAVEVLMDSRMRESVFSVEKAMKGIKGVEACMSRVAGSQASTRDWQILHFSLVSIVQVASFVRGLQPQQTPAVRLLAVGAEEDAMLEGVHACSAVLQHYVDW